MSRVKTGKTRRARHKKILKKTKGYYGGRSKIYKTAHEAFLHAGEYAFAGRKQRKRDLRSLWIQRINAALEPHDMSYSQFIRQLKTATVELDRKIIAEIAVNNEKDFKALIDLLKK